MRRLLGLGIVILGIVAGIIVFLSKRSPVQPEMRDQRKGTQAYTAKPLDNNRIARPNRVPTGKNAIALSNFEEDPRIMKILAKSSAEARDQFERALKVLRTGIPREALTLFLEITWKYPDDSVAPLAEWGVALAYYRRGGPGWALFAAEDFNQYCKKHSDSEELVFLVQAAANNRAVIERGLMEFDPSELLVPQGPTKGELSSDPIKMTRITVEAFMTEFPQSSLKTNAQQVLARIQEYTKR